MGSDEAKFVAAFGKTASDYAYTDSLTDTDWAWEFLRRNPDYQLDYYIGRAHLTRAVGHSSGLKIYRTRGCHQMAKKWGLEILSNPIHNAYQTHVFWTQELLRYSIVATSTVKIEKEIKPDIDLFNSKNCCAILCDERSQKVILRFPNTELDMKLNGASILFSPVMLQFHIDGFERIGNGTKALVWARNALQGRQISDNRVMTKATKLHRKKSLIALDCRMKGASLRDTAFVFRAYRLTRLSWSTSGDEALKKQVWRSRNTGLKLMQGGYRKFL